MEPARFQSTTHILEAMFSDEDSLSLSGEVDNQVLNQMPLIPLSLSVVEN